MEYKIFGDIFPAVTLTLHKNESIYTQSGGMGCMSENIKMETQGRGGLFKSLGRMINGESLFTVNYTSTCDNSDVTIVANYPGEIMALNLYKDYSILAQSGSFLCAQQSIEVSVKFAKKLSAGLFGGEGFILQELTGSGLVFLETAGNLLTHELSDGEVLLVDTGNLVAFESSVSYETKMVKGLKNVVFGGEGLFLTKMVGPGKVWVQTGNMQNLAMTLSPFLVGGANR
ncbi:MAG: TIGR00266 family protein [Epulopiscium sp. Nuni2H_MBin001]|nr:MAG: TIGR00266 family protein [Epulopiscium sp. Nuni2H_MBin001]